MDMYWTPATQSNGGSQIGYISALGGDIASVNGAGVQFYNNGYYLDSNNGAASQTYFGSYLIQKYLSSISISTSAVNGYLNDYVLTGSITTNLNTIPPSSPLYLEIAQVSATYNTLVTWVRTRAYPPNGVMPAASVGTSVETTPPFSGSSFSKRIALHNINTTLGGPAGNHNYSIAVFSNDIVYTTPFSAFNYSNTGDSYNNTPSVAGSIAYMLLGSNHFVGFDAPSGKILFNISLPYDFYSYPFSNIALSGGRAYVPDGNTLYAFGESTLPANTSALSALASLYIDHRGGLADALLSSIYNTSHIGIFINGTYAPSLYVSSFSGSSGSYVNVPGGFTSPEASNHAMSMCYWFKINSLAGFNGIIFKGTAMPSSGNVPEYSIGSNGIELGFNITSSSGTPIASANAPGPVSGNDIGHWMFSCTAYNASTSTAIYYLNGTAYYGTASNVLFATAGTGNMVMGAGPHGGSAIDLANIQLYGTNITVANMGRLYYSGMFGSPLSGAGLVSWWPMLGDANDYYGNSTGFPYATSYVPSGYISRQLLNAYQISGAGSPIPVYNNGTYSIRNVSVVIWS